MALWTYAPFTADDAKRFIRVEGTLDDNLIEDCISEAAQRVEEVYGHEMGSRGTLTEHYPRWGMRMGHPDDPTLFYPDQFPIYSVTSVKEAGTTLTVNTDYVLVADRTGQYTAIRRISSGFPVAWPYNTSTTTYRHVELVYGAGFKNHDGTPTGALAYPAGLLKVIRDMTAWIYQFRVGGQQGLVSMSDDLGNRTFQGPPIITSGLRSDIWSLGGVPQELRQVLGERAA